MRQTTVYLLSSILILAVCVQPVMGASIAADTAPVSESLSFSNTPTDAVDPAVQNSSGQLQVIVQLSDPEFETFRLHTEPQAALQSHATRTQQPLLDYANTTPGIRVIDQFWITNAVLVEIDRSRASFTRLTDLRHVTRVHANFDISTERLASPSQLSRQDSVVGSASASGSASNTTYGLNQINAVSAWSQFDTQGSGTTVAALDTGVDTRNHTDLSVTPNGWRDFVNNRSQPYDNNGHGTHVSGTIVGGQTPSGDHYGVAPNTTLIHGKVLDSSGSGSFADILVAMEWVITHESGVDVLSLSIGTDGYEAAFIEPVANLRDAGIVVVAAAGNDGPESSSSPGNVYESLSIGASTPDGTIGEFSAGEAVTVNGSWNGTAPESWPGSYIVPDVAAPGVGVNSAVPGGEFQQASGTSMATPHVAGAIALLQAATATELSPAAIDSYLTETAWKPDGVSAEPDTRYGAGIVDIHAAITRARGGNATPQFTLSQPSLSNSTVLVNESVTTSVDVSNIGNATGTFTGTLAADSDPLDTNSIRLSPGDTAELKFTSSFTRPGSYQVSVNETAVGTLRVDRPANLKILTTDINTTTVHPGESIKVSATIGNLGDRTGTYRGEFRSNGEVIHSTAQTVSPVSSETISFAHTFSTSGEYTITLNGSAIGTVFVRERPTLVIDSYSVTPNPVLRGTPTNMTVTVENRCDSAKEFTADIRANGRQIVNNSALIPANESRTLSYTHRFDSAGEYSLTVTQSPIGNIVVERPAIFNFSPLTLSSQRVSVNESFTVSTTVRNVGDRPGRVRRALRANNATIDRKSRFLLPQRERSISFTISFNQPDTYTLAYGSASPTSVSVSAENTSLSQYRDSEGVVDTPGLRRAIDDWRNGAISTELLREVIAAWRRG